ncbi:HEXA_B [Mytilus coruscus]|uniref:beta-N-acetylhexosaminidase n=1 Tax=Mytilus coruscus TaxID=42192 RepID=A0A6J8A9F1_MYTCO|nr:HEXA_B [Mytilus coruscus]
MEVTKWMVHVCVFLVTGIVHSQIVTQTDLNNIADKLEIKVDVIRNSDNGSVHLFKVTFNNKASQSLSGYNWKIYFYSFFIVEPSHILSEDGLYTKPEGYTLPNVNLKLMHENGCLFSMSPTTEFIGLLHNEKREITFSAALWAISKTDFPPNWYMTADGLNARVISSTKAEFVGEFTSEKQWKRKKTDKYDPYSTSVRYQRYKTTNSNVQQKVVLPTPKEITNQDSTKILDISGNVTIVHSGLDKEASFITDKYNFHIGNTASSSGVNIYLSINNSISSTEGYTLSVNPSAKWVTIGGKTNTGVFYGVQSLLSLLSRGNSIPQIEIRDEPRFGFRGMYVDVARNFISKTVLEKLMDAMAMYKLNKLHIHLADDEGWRVEINGLPELTEVMYKLNKLHFPLADDEGWRVEINGLPELTQVMYKLNKLHLHLPDDGDLRAEDNDLPELTLIMYKLNKLHLHLSDEKGWRVEVNGLSELTQVNYKLNKLHLHLPDDDGWRVEVNGLPELTQIMYKLNILHLHLSDDKGWRVEANGLPELTEVGSKRCHSEKDYVCLIPQLGSGPDNTTSGSGFYSIQEYKDILRYAKKRHIEVIPEIDMPGHARAAIIAMEARYRKHNNKILPKLSSTD